MRKFEEKKIFRVIDANLNRAKEGLRVCEDVSRFVVNDAKTTKAYKVIRHKLSNSLFNLPLNQKAMIKARDIQKDVGKKSEDVEFCRDNIKDIFWANSQRIKESVRVLEEFAKLIQKKKAEDFKKIRYKIYGLEREIIKKF